MSHARHRKVNRAEKNVRAYLATLPWPWSIEQASKHKKVVLNGRMVGVLSNSRDNGQDGANVISAARRLVAQWEAGQ